MKRYIQLVGFLAAPLLLLGCGQLDASAVSQARTQLASTASEGSLLAEGAAGVRFTSPYVAVRAAELADDASQIESSLDDRSVAPAARGQARSLRQAAHGVAANLQRLTDRPGDRALAADVAGQLKQAGAELQR